VYLSKNILVYPCGWPALEYWNMLFVPDKGKEDHVCSLLPSQTPFSRLMIEGAPEPLLLMGNLMCIVRHVVFFF